jgi:hypothetical protein
MMNKHFIVITAVMVIGLFGLSATANGQETFEAVTPDFVVACNSTDQLCDPPFPVSGETGSVLQVQYFVRSTHCSSLRVRLFVDGTLKVTTGFLGWPGAPSPFAELPLDTGLLDFVLLGAHLRRLMYVAPTRPEDMLFITCSMDSAFIRDIRNTGKVGLL